MPNHETDLHKHALAQGRFLFSLWTNLWNRDACSQAYLQASALKWLPPVLLPASAVHTYRQHAYPRESIPKLLTCLLRKIKQNGGLLICNRGL